jgi:hypothetical protein
MEVRRLVGVFREEAVEDDDVEVEVGVDFRNPHVDNAPAYLESRKLSTEHGQPQTDGSSGHRHTRVGGRGGKGVAPSRMKTPTQSNDCETRRIRHPSGGLAAPLAQLVLNIHAP